MGVVGCDETKQWRWVCGVPEGDEGDVDLRQRREEGDMGVVMMKSEQGRGVG